MASPSMTTTNAAGNLLASTSIAASGTNSTTNLDASAAFEAQVQVSVTFGTISSTSGLQIDVYRRIGSGPATDTRPIISLVIPSTASTTTLQSFALPTGRYNIKLTNLDAANSVTGVSLTSDVVLSVS
jgi:hypothetical protein